MQESSSIASLREAIRHLTSEINAQIVNAKSLKEAEELKIKILGKKGPIQGLMPLLKSIESEERPFAGKLINDLKEEVEKTFQELLEKFSSQEEAAKLALEHLDITLPGRRGYLGRKHPILAMQDRIVDVMIEMGFSIQYGSDIESDYYNFEALNYPKDHPARDMQDTFYLSPDMLLRTHNTSMQVRMMESHLPPLRIACPGNVYRNEEITARSHVFFHQMDALYIDKGVSFADPFATLSQFFSKLFGHTVETRIRPSYFPFVEPGMEVDIHCMLCEGAGCHICKQAGWLEVAGAGMVHPEVLKNGGIDPEIYTGYAWGMGIERLVLVQKSISDIRLFTENDMRFLEQFP